jgi:hypothetical protein
MAVKKFSLEAVIDLTDKMTKPMQNVEKKMTGFSKKMQKNFGGVGNDIKSLDKGINKVAVGAVVGAAALGAGAFAVGKSFVDAGAEVEKYKTTITTMLGSVDKANARFEEMSQFAASTPFELNEVVALGNQLQALGQYSKENMTLLGDLAAASGKPIDQVTNAFAKLVSGQKGEAVNMFRDLLISTKDWADATGKGVSKSGELLATTDEMMAALPKILGKKGFSGMMDNLSKSYEGMSSNFHDTITRFKQNIGSMLLPAAKNLMGVLTKKMVEFSDISTEKGKKFVASITKFMDDLAVAIEKFDLAKFIENVGNTISTIKGVIDFLAPLAPIILGLVVAVKAITIAMGIYNAVMWLVSLNPITLTITGIVAVIAILAVGITAMVKHWDSVVAVLKVVGGFFVNIGQTIMKWMLMPINLALDSISNLIGLLSKLPGMSSKLTPALSAIKGFQNGMNQTLTGTTGAYDYGGVWKDGYSNPSTRTAASSSTTSTTRSIVDLKAPAGWGMMPQGYGGAPRQTLNFGGAQ